MAKPPQPCSKPVSRGYRAKCAQQDGARLFGGTQLTTAGEGPAAMVLDLAVEPTINLSAVRGHIATALHDLGEDHLYDVVLVVTELVSNVLDHTPGTGRLRVFRHTTRCEITIEVDDRSPVQPVHGHSRLGGTRGRGIVVVDNVARSWGTRPLPDGGKTVFASVPCPDAEN